jgi:hypothetical protein
VLPRAVARDDVTHKHTQRMLRGDVDADVPMYGARGKDAGALRSAFVQVR